MFKKFLAIAGFLIAAHAQAVVIQCDPNGTGSAQYPNVQCNSAGAMASTMYYGQQPQALTDGSGSITTGGTSQQVFAANSARQYLLIQNTSSANEYINFGTAAATTASILLIPNASFIMEDFTVSNQAINIYGATTGQTFVAKQK